MRFPIFMLAVLLQGPAAFSQRDCQTTAYRNQLLKSGEFSTKILEAESSLDKAILNKEIISGTPGSSPAAPSVITIPVVVHIVYNSEAQNISDEQVRSQIEALNRDFRALSSELKVIPEQFSGTYADTYIEFKLALVDPEGRATTGITRKKTTILMFGLDDRIKSSSRGGADAWDSDRYLNIWIGNLAGGLIGYSSPLGSAKLVDGVVIRSTAFGTSGTVAAPFNKGRTATHEIGHWLGLKHIWGDEYCGDDLVGDTPPQQMATRGCPAVVSTSCNNAGNMYMNFMDFTNDACMSLFTRGQRERMRAVFETGGCRNALLSSNGLSGIPIETPPVEIIAGSRISLYPNPVASVLTIDLGVESIDQPFIRIYNQFGQLLKQQRLSGRVSHVNTSTLAKGVYFVKLGSVKKSFRFVKVQGRE